MVSMRKPVRFSGVLRGEGHEANCAVSALKVTMPGGAASAYTQFTVNRVESALPDGRYKLTVNGQKILLRHHGGKWISW